MAATQHPRRHPPLDLGRQMADQVPVPQMYPDTGFGLEGRAGEEHQFVPLPHGCGMRGPLSEYGAVHRAAERGGRIRREGRGGRTVHAVMYPFTTGPERWMARAAGARVRRPRANPG